MWPRKTQINWIKLVSILANFLGDTKKDFSQETDEEHHKCILNFRLWLRLKIY